MVAIRTGIGQEVHVDRRQAAVLFRPNLHPHLGHVARGVADKLFFAGIVEIDRTAGHAGSPSTHLFQQDILLGAKAAADPLFDHVDLMLLEPDDPGNLTAQVPRHLG
ncbi:hypothetical protein D3C81_1896500 [compost metagenome]